ncbi:MAG: hypothetical protein H7315_19995 [Herminiimonas sp.]|nr:hypothetical protein [Herminiimonas sp.]
MLYQVKEVSDVYADACIRDESGKLLFASLYGRDGALLQLLSSFSLKTSEGGLAGFTLIDEVGKAQGVTVSNVDRLDKLSGRLPKANLFGNLAHTFVYDSRLVEPDYANRVAWVLYEPQPDDPLTIEQRERDRAWPVIKALSPIPLLDSWRETLLDLTADTVIRSLSKTSYPPMGRLTGIRIELTDAFLDTVTTAVQAFQLRVDDGETAPLTIAPESISPAKTYRLVLGQVVMTPGVQAALNARPHYARELLKRHQAGDWGEVCKSDQKANNDALANGCRVLSAYPIEPSRSYQDADNRIWIITEADRSVTTLLLPDEY